MPCIRIAYIRHPEAFVHFFLQIFDNILYVGQNRITLSAIVLLIANNNEKYNGCRFDNKTGKEKGRR